ncbi:MAG: hypothetical protein C5B47_04345 [Verrucomicrobia bacterium]|nr:MAG: hypothetical protein C5B47_04345 [Verrucomicrobiota bacterium]
MISTCSGTEFELKYEAERLGARSRSAWSLMHAFLKKRCTLIILSCTRCVIGDIYQCFKSIDSVNGGPEALKNHSFYLQCFIPMSRQRSSPVIVTVLFVSHSAVFGIVPGIPARSRHILTLKENGEVGTWNDNPEAQLRLLGGGRKIRGPIEVWLSCLTDIIAMTGGERFSAAPSGKQKLFAWGRNSVGQLGLGNEITIAIPFLLPELTEVLQIAPDSVHPTMQLQNRPLQAWGFNDLGQFENDIVINRHVPAAVSELSEIINTGADKKHSSAVSGNATKWSWRKNKSERFGVLARCGPHPAMGSTSNSLGRDVDGVADERAVLHLKDLMRAAAVEIDKDDGANIREILFSTNPQIPDTDDDNLRDIADVSMAFHFGVTTSKEDVNAATHLESKSLIQHECPKEEK